MTLARTRKVWMTMYLPNAVEKHLFRKPEQRCTLPARKFAVGFVMMESTVHKFAGENHLYPG